MKSLRLTQCFREKLSPTRNLHFGFLDSELEDVEGRLASVDPLKRDDHSLAGHCLETFVNVVEVEFIEVALNVFDKAVRAKDLGAGFAESIPLWTVLVVDVFAEVHHVLLHDLDVIPAAPDLGRDKVSGANKVEGLGAIIHDHVLDVTKANHMLEKTWIDNFEGTRGKGGLVFIRNIDPAVHFGTSGR